MTKKQGIQYISAFWRGAC